MLLRSRKRMLMRESFGIFCASLVQSLHAAKFRSGKIGTGQIRAGKIGIENFRLAQISMRQVCR